MTNIAIYLGATTSDRTERAEPNNPTQENILANLEKITETPTTYLYQKGVHYQQ